MIDYQLLRSARKTLSLQVKQGSVFVRAPYHVDEAIIHSFIHKKDAWLRAKIVEQNKTVDFCCNFTQGSKLYVLGELVTLNIILANSNEKTDVFLAELTNGEQVLTVILSARIHHTQKTQTQRALTVKKHIERYFTEQAQQLILPKVDQYSAITQLTPKNIKIRQYRARWGSCNSRGELSFNYLLMMLPKQVIDYVVVHELCHLRYLNHSTDFWQLVAQYFPDYSNAKQWIKSNQSALVWRTPTM
jgi:predicted metal-dependent hydrolase